MSGKCYEEKDARLKEYRVAGVRRLFLEGDQSGFLEALTLEHRSEVKAKPCRFLEEGISRKRNSRQMQRLRDKAAVTERQGGCSRVNKAERDCRG